MDITVACAHHVADFARANQRPQHNRQHDLSRFSKNKEKGNGLRTRRPTLLGREILFEIKASRCLSFSKKGRGQHLKRRPHCGFAVLRRGIRLRLWLTVPIVMQDKNEVKPLKVPFCMSRYTVSCEKWTGDQDTLSVDFIRFRGSHLSRHLEMSRGKLSRNRIRITGECTGD